MAADLLPVVAGCSLQLAAAGVLVWAATRRTGLAGAAAAHAAWGGLLAAFVLLPVLQLAVRPAWLIVPSAGTTGPAATWQAIAGRAPLAEVVYIAIAGSLLGRILVDLAAVARLTARSVPVGAEAVQALPALAGARAGGLDLLETAALAAPATAGAWRRRIFLPVGWRELPAADLHGMMAHELAHVARRDALTLLGARLVVAVFWFHPVAWLALARIRWFAEVACDAAAVPAAGTVGYARLLLAAGRRAGRGPALAPGATSSVAQRVSLLLSDAPAGRRHRLAFVVLLLLPLGALVRVGSRPSAVGDGAVTAAHAAAHLERHAARHHH
jgi:beta-lactamase regulating signal transducer with metallopeptidase domain